MGLAENPFGWMWVNGGQRDQRIRAPQPYYPAFLYLPKRHCLLSRMMLGVELLPRGAHRCFLFIFTILASNEPLHWLWVHSSKGQGQEGPPSPPI